VVLGVLPALDATRCLLSVEAPAAVGPSLLSLNPVEVGQKRLSGLEQTAIARSHAAARDDCQHPD